MFFSKDNKLESKSKFYCKIEDYYFNISKEEVPREILEKIIVKVVNDKYKFYQECWKKYPKSRKRYSIFKIEDLEHPYIYFLILNYLEGQDINSKELKEYSKILFKMNNEEVDKIIDYKDWYDTK